ncbi:MAG TPA: DUF5916 domain-containing protein [Gemmatimonadaceae bacterium]|nr:DUF5916 domain-containing protein [Gemmatimonadaceae bacterium]
MSRCRRMLSVYVVALVCALGAIDAQSLGPKTAELRAPSGRRRTVAYRTDRAPVIDGRLDDEAWRGAPVAADFVQQSPDPGQPATQRTEVRVLLDRTALYVGMRLFDSAPDSIAAPLARRDYTGYSDWAQVVVDSYGDHRTAFRFAMNPSGVKRDSYISGDAEWTEDLGWDAVWEGAAARDSAGWTAEFRIPLSQLRFSPSRDSAGITWGIQFIRDLARRSERSMWAPIPPSSGRFVSLFGDLEGVHVEEAHRLMELTPYTLARGTTSGTNAGNPLARVRDGSVIGGADFKVAATSNVTITGTLNPDFGQVEADPSQVNLTGIETFFAERRPFFVEGADLFRYGLSSGDWAFGGEQLFYSRRIGRRPQGSLPDSAAFTDSPTATPIIGAAKVVGRSNGWLFGALSAVTGETRGRYLLSNGIARSQVIEPLTHYGVYRLARDFDQGNSSFGLVATATNRHISDSTASLFHSSAFAGGVEGRWRFGPARQFRLSGYVFGSRITGPPAAILATDTGITHLFQRPDAPYLRPEPGATSLSGVASEVRIERIDGPGPRYALSGHVVSSGFDINDLGFLNSSDVLSSVGHIGQDWYHETKFTRTHSLWVNAWSLWGTHGERRATGANLWTHVQFQNFWEIAGYTAYSLPGMSAALLRGGPAVRTSDSVHFSYHVNSDPRRAVSAGLQLSGRHSTADAGASATIAPMLTLRPSARLEVQVQPSSSWTRDLAQYVASPVNATGTHYLTGDLHQRTASLTARFSYAFTRALTLQGYAQPFVSAGYFSSIAEVVRPRSARQSDRVRPFSADGTRRSPDSTRLLLTSPGGTLTIGNPDFSVGDFNANMVLRWEYRPGSTVFMVWNQGQSTQAWDGNASLSRLSNALWTSPATTVFLVKWSHYLGR